VTRGDRELAVHLVDQLPADVKAETGSSDASCHVRVESVELLEDSLLPGRRDAYPLVGDLYDAEASVCRDANLDQAAAG
jgi:hypothetical protein